MKYEPEWKKFEKDLHNEDSDKARWAAVAFDETRKEELKNSSKAREWEESRKDSWIKDKPEWKKQQIKNEKEELDKITNQLLEGGYLMNGLKPRSGLILIKEEKIQDDQSPIYVPDSVKYEANTARVVRCSDDIVSSGTNIPCPCAEGDLILVREGAGLHLKIKDEKMLLIRFDEVFGIVEE